MNQKEGGGGGGRAERASKMPQSERGNNLYMCESERGEERD